LLISSRASTNLLDVSANRSVFTVLLLLSAAVLQLPAQQTETARAPFEELKAKAEAGDADSEYQVGLRYYKGEGVSKDLAEAVKWFRKAAEQGLAGAQDNLGVCYAKGQGVAKDEVEAVKWFRKAAEQNYAQAQRNLGWCYAKGQGVAKDEVEAVKWFRKAAEQNEAIAQDNQGKPLEGSVGFFDASPEGVDRARQEAAQGHEEHVIRNGETGKIDGYLPEPAVPEQEAPSGANVGPVATPTPANAFLPAKSSTPNASKVSGWSTDHLMKRRTELVQRFKDDSFGIYFGVMRWVSHAIDKGKAKKEFLAISNELNRRGIRVSTEIPKKED
jgi:hypothetical protein